MIRIGVLGANGQVGSEVCLFLSGWDDVEVVPVCRNELASAFLRKCGFSCRHGSIQCAEHAQALLEGCDLVADFTLPHGLPSEVRIATRQIVANSIRHSLPNARFVYISSICALGMGKTDRVLRRYLFARTIYGASKRFGERFAFRCARAAGKEAYALRLGQVHGEVQGVSGILRARVRENGDATTYVPEGASYTVFACSIAEGLVNIARGRHRPGVYSFVSVPQWEWREVYDYYCRRAGVRPRVALEPSPPERSWRERLVWMATIYGARPAIGLGMKHAEWIGGHLLVHFPAWEGWLSAAYRRQEARNAGMGARGFRPFDDRWIGAVPGRIFSAISDSRQTMEARAESVRRILQTLGPPKKIGSGRSEESSEAEIQYARSNGGG